MRTDLKDPDLKDPDPKDTEQPSPILPAYAAPSPVTPAYGTPPPVQRFFSPALKRQINIKARFDTKTGVYVILWMDVQRFFQNISIVRAGDVAVGFMTDDNLNVYVEKS
ncbi:hypothetical protein BGZ58_004274 [Dissophora ornata]|nr:hypothetical protein BGZ58_004274 [Dissophora ornata]